MKPKLKPKSRKRVHKIYILIYLPNYRSSEKNCLQNFLSWLIAKHFSLKYSHISFGVIERYRKKGKKKEEDDDENKVENGKRSNVSPYEKLYKKKSMNKIRKRHVVYNTSFGRNMEKIHVKEFDCSELYELTIPHEKYKQFINYLEVKTKEKTPYNYMSFFLNFCPFSKCCNLKGSGMICSQACSDALTSSNILNPNFDPIFEKTYKMRVGDVLESVLSQCGDKIKRLGIHGN